MHIHLLDGNKRTGFEVAEIILNAEGYEITASDGEAFNFILKLAREVIDIDEIVEWLEKNKKELNKLPHKSNTMVEKTEVLKLRKEYQEVLEESAEKRKDLLKRLAKL